MSSYQGPEPALFTVNVPALDGGKRHRVGVLQTQGDKEDKMFKSKGGDVHQRPNTTPHIPDPVQETTNHGTTQPTATDPLSKAARRATEPATCTPNHRHDMGQAASRDGGSQADGGEGMREKAMNGPNFIGRSLLFFLKRTER